MSKEKNFKNMDSLKPVQRILDDADEALKNPYSTIKDSPISEVLAGALGAGLGGGLSFVALYALGTVGLSAAGITSGLAAAGALVGGGMVAGVFVLAAPVAILGGGAALLMARRNKKRLLQAKERMLQDAIRKRDAILRELENEVGKSKEHIEHLKALNILLQAVIRDLQADLAA